MLEYLKDSAQHFWIFELFLTTIVSYRGRMVQTLADRNLFILEVVKR